MCDAGILRLTFFSKRAYPPHTVCHDSSTPWCVTMRDKAQCRSQFNHLKRWGLDLQYCNICLAFIDNGLGVLKSTKFYKINKYLKINFSDQCRRD